MRLLLFTSLLVAVHASALELESAPPARAWVTPVVLRTDAEAQMALLTRSPWSWQTPRGTSVIEFAADGTCYHTRFNGSYELRGGSRLLVHMQSRDQELVVDLEKGEFTGHDKVLQQAITGRRMAVGESSSPKKVHDAQVDKLARTPWTWETAMGRTTIRFEKNHTCTHTNFTGTFETQPDDTILIKMPKKEQVLIFDFARGEYSGYDLGLKQKITGKREAQK